MNPIEGISYSISAFSAEVINGDFTFIRDNHFTGLNHLQHMSIYGIFAVHGLIDVFTSIGTPLPPKADYMSAAVAFAWYGLAFQYHASMVSQSITLPC